jgi:UDP-2,3-diacylglucosamine hydrolase
MIDAVFISDLHLHPDNAAITYRFERFIEWASSNARAVYILGDFFHVWPGDDGLDEFSWSIAGQLADLQANGVNVFFMPGNRDFLLGKAFASIAKLILLPDPTVIDLGGEQILLAHGDRYCTRDTGHQWLRRLTRNWFFPKLFMKLPLSRRIKIVNEVRRHSQSNRSKPPLFMEIVVSSMITHMRKLNVRNIIHGHIHVPGKITHQEGGDFFQQYVLSDWDDKPFIMCYDQACGFYFVQPVESEHAN